MKSKVDRVQHTRSNLPYNNSEAEIQRLLRKRHNKRIFKNKYKTKPRNLFLSCFQTEKQVSLCELHDNPFFLTSQVKNGPKIDEYISDSPGKPSLKCTKSINYHKKNHGRDRRMNLNFLSKPNAKQLKQQEQRKVQEEHEVLAVIQGATRQLYHSAFDTPTALIKSRNKKQNKTKVFLKKNIIPKTGPTSTSMNIKTFEVSCSNTPRGTWMTNSDIQYNDIMQIRNRKEIEAQKQLIVSKLNYCLNDTSTASSSSSSGGRQPSTRNSATNEYNEKKLNYDSQELNNTVSNNKTIDRFRRIDDQLYTSASTKMDTVGDDNWLNIRVNINTTVNAVATPTYEQRPKTSPVRRARVSTVVERASTARRGALGGASHKILLYRYPAKSRTTPSNSSKIPKLVYPATITRERKGQVWNDLPATSWNRVRANGTADDYEHQERPRTTRSTNSSSGSFHSTDKFTYSKQFPNLFVIGVRAL